MLKFSALILRIVRIDNAHKFVDVARDMVRRAKLSNSHLECFLIFGLLACRAFKLYKNDAPAVDKVR